MNRKTPGKGGPGLILLILPISTLGGAGKAHREVVNTGRNCRAFSGARAP